MKFFVLGYVGVIVYIAMCYIYSKLLLKAGAKVHVLFVLLSCWIVIPTFLIYTITLKILRWGTDYNDLD